MMSTQEENPVLLGVCDEPVPDDDSFHWSSSKLGGEPTWLDVRTPPDNLTCQLCGRPLSLIIQLYCPLADSPYHRVIHIFTCPTSQCSNKAESWYVLRSQLPDTSNQQSDQCADHGRADSQDEWGGGMPQGNVCDWAADADNWGDVDDETMDTGVTMETVVTTVSSSDRPAEDKEERTEDGRSTRLAEEVLRKMNIEETDSDDSSIPDIEAVSHCVTEDIAIKPHQSQLLGLLRMDAAKGERTVSDKDKVKVEPARNVTSHDAESLDRTGTSGDMSHDVTTVHCVKSHDASCRQHVTFQPYYISVIEEPMEADSSSSRHEVKLLAEYVRREGLDLEAATLSAGSGKGGGGERYEKAAAKHGDTFFHKFKKRLGLYPQQIIRYSHGGEPCLLRSLKQTEAAPHCGRCGAQRVFEIQLMPTLLSVLQNNSQDVSVEFGTVLIFTCSRNCWDEGASACSEHVVLQPDPDSHLFK